MEARVKDFCKWNRVTAFAGQEYTKKQWHPVPHGYEDEALAHSMLDAQMPPAIDYASMNKKELLAQAAREGVAVNARMNKASLVSLLSATDEEE